MNIRILLIELFFFSLPFVMFGVYRLLVRDAEADGKKSWPISFLFILGAALAMAYWFYLVAVKEDRETNKCIEPARYENGVYVPATTYFCEKDLDSIGEALSDDPGGPSTPSEDSPEP